MRLLLLWKRCLLIASLCTGAISQTVSYALIDNDVYDRNVFIRAVGQGDIVGTSPDKNFYGSWGTGAEAHFLKLATGQVEYWKGLTDSLSGSFTGWELGGYFHISDKPVSTSREVKTGEVGNKYSYINVPMHKRKVLAVGGGMYGINTSNFWAGEFDGDENILAATNDPLRTTSLAEGCTYDLSGLYVGIMIKSFFNARVRINDEWNARIPRQTNRIYLDFLLGGGTLEGKWSVTKATGAYGQNLTTDTFELSSSDSEKYYQWKSTGWRLGFDINRYQNFGRYVGLSFYGEIGMRPGLAKDALYATLGMGLGFGI